MFMHAAAFNSDISKWDISRVKKMDYMFWGATSFRHNLCGAAWVYSKASKKYLFAGSRGSIRWEACITTTTHQYVTRRPLIERELKIARPAISTPVGTSTLAIASTNAITCAKCGSFKKSGRASCCAPGGAWFKNCGVAGNRNVHHKWFEGVAACKRKSKVKSLYM